MTKLLEHIRAMQGMASRYLEPGPYVDRDGTTSTDADTDVGGDFEKRFAAHLFVSDLLYMLDGPEQRAAERDHANTLEAFRAQVGDLEDANAAMRDRVAVSESDKGRATKALGEERAVQNDLRDRLMTAELAYAKLHGYLEGRRESDPPVMVPQHRQPFLADMPDASGPRHGAGGWSPQSKPAWFHR